jgi:CheY-like chemotaxis protein
MHGAVLHVEDNRDLVETVALGFSHLGFQGELLNAATVSNALNTIRSRQESSTPLDLIIVDMSLPDGTGLDLIRQVKSNPAWSSIPIIVLSNNTDPDIVAEAYALGANCYFPKVARNTSAFDAIEALYSCWFNIALLPHRSRMSPVREVLGRSVSVNARLAKFYLELARRFSDNQDQSRLWLDLALNKSSQSNLIAYFDQKIDQIALSPANLKRTKKFVGQRESNFLVVQRESAINSAPTIDDALGWAVQIEQAFDPELSAVVMGYLFPNAPAATLALMQNTINYLTELVNAVRSMTTRPETLAGASSIKKNVEKLRKQNPVSAVKH